MKNEMKIPKVTFRVREGDEISSEGGCPIGGEWLNTMILSQSLQ